MTTGNIHWCDCTENGELFGWGNTEYNQLGGGQHSDEMQVSIPRHIPLPDVGRIVKAAAAGSACAVVNGNLQYCSSLHTHLSLLHSLTH